MDWLSGVFDMINKNPSAAMLTISLAVNVVLARALVKSNQMYINLLKENGDLVKQMKQLFERFKIKEIGGYNNGQGR